MRQNVQPRISKCWLYFGYITRTTSENITAWRLYLARSYTGFISTTWFDNSWEQSPQKWMRPSVTKK